ncbi:MAG: NF038129 family PEP-CTERM protein [Gammaproteobacteria bacterium]
MISSRLHTLLKMLPLLFILCAAQVARGNALYDVTLNTSALIGHPAAPFYLEFQLNDGVGTGDTNNTAVLSNFTFDSGNAVGTPTLTGGASGDLTTTVTLNDSTFFNEAYQEFNPGNTLSFRVDLTTSVDPGPQPDQFSFAIFDCTLSEIPTLSPANALLAADINGPTPVMHAYAGDASSAPKCGGNPIYVPAAVVTSVPLPAAGLLFSAGLMVVQFGARWRAHVAVV